MPKRVPPLTDRQLLNAKAKATTYKLFDGGGLYLEVTPGGSKLWKFKYRRPGKAEAAETRIALGAYPQISLAEARVQREAARRQLALGEDPGAARRAAAVVLLNKPDLAFMRVAREWHVSMLKAWQPGTAHDIWHRLEVDIFPVIGSQQITALTPRDILAPLRKIEARGALELARRNAANIVRILDYAVVCGDIAHNPAAKLIGVLAPQAKGHFAALGPDQIPEFCDALQSNRTAMGPIVRIGMYLMALLFVRTCEMIETPWTEIPLESNTAPWIIPWRRMKMGRRRLYPIEMDHAVPLPWQARELFRELHLYTGGGKLVFPNERDSSRPMSSNTFLKVLERMGYKGDMTGHGFRALAMTTLKERLHYRHEVVDRQLAHVQESKTDAAYDRAFYLEERRKMLQDWADYLYSFGL
jgi:integrase